MRHYSPLAQASPKEVAKTILDQMGGQRRLQAMIGAANFLIYNNPPGVSFKFMQTGKPSKTGNLVKILLDEDLDLYDVEFGYTRGMSYRKIKNLVGIQAENLSQVFRSQTGLALRIASQVPRRERTAWTTRQAGGITLWAAVWGDGKVVGATDDIAGSSPGYWGAFARQDNFNIYKLSNVPLPIAEQLSDVGTRAQRILQGKAWEFIQKYSTGPRKSAHRETKGLEGWSTLPNGSAGNKGRFERPGRKSSFARGKRNLGPRKASWSKRADDISDVLYLHDDICLDDDRDRRELVQDLAEVTGLPNRKIEPVLRGHDECLDDPRVRKSIQLWIQRMGPTRTAGRRNHSLRKTPLSVSDWLAWEE